jgi:hypothetical protein
MLSKWFEANLVLLLAIFFVSFISVANASTTKNACELSLLTEAQTDLLNRLSEAPTYQVKIMRPPENAGTKLLVLIGESHIVQLEEVGLEKEIQSEFSTFAIERSGADRTWAVRSGLFKLGSILGLPELLIRTLWTFRGFNFGPTEVLTEEMKNGPQADRTIVDIEEEHEPGFAENVAAIILSIDMGTSGVCGLSACAHFLGLSHAGGVSLGAAITWLSFKAYEHLLQSSFMKSRPKLKDRLNYLTYLKTGRDISMAWGGQALMDSKDGITVAVVGKDHLPGIATILNSRGFKEISISK